MTLVTLSYGSPLSASGSDSWDTSGSVPGSMTGDCTHRRGRDEGAMSGNGLREFRGYVFICSRRKADGSHCYIEHVFPRGTRRRTAEKLVREHYKDAHRDQPSLAEARP